MSSCHRSFTLSRQNAVKKRLEHLNEEFRSLEELILRGKQQTMDEDDEDDEDEGCEMTVHCVTCGADVQTRTAIRHMERCYNKVRLVFFIDRFISSVHNKFAVWLKHTLGFSDGVANVVCFKVQDSD